MKILNLSFIHSLTSLLVLLIACQLNGQPAVEVLNKGIPGNTTSDLLRRIDQDVLNKAPDICIILVGTNDLLNTSKMITLSEYTQNIRALTERTTHAGIKTILISPPPVDTTYLFQRHHPSKYSMPPNRLLKNVSNSISIICDQENILFIDLFQKLKKRGIPDHNKDMIIQNEANMDVSDGVHFTAQGNELLAEFVYQKLMELQMDSKPFRIVCFGDSLTYGVRMKGAGTSTGDTYPAYLKYKIIS